MFIHSFALVSQDFSGVFGVGPRAPGLAHRKGHCFAETGEEGLHDPQKLSADQLVVCHGQILGENYV